MPLQTPRAQETSEMHVKVEERESPPNCGTLAIPSGADETDDTYSNEVGDPSDEECCSIDSCNIMKRPSFDGDDETDDTYSCNVMKRPSFDGDDETDDTYSNEVGDTSDEECCSIDSCNVLELPSVLYDPESESLMVDPVVLPSGDSRERTTAENMLGMIYYPNRALQALLLDYSSRVDPFDVGSTMRATLGEAWDESIRSSNGASQHATFSSSIRSWVLGPPRKLHESLYCPITCDLMTEPVITPDGYTYEKTAIQQWIALHGTSPITRNAMTKSQLFPNNAIADITRRALGKPPLVKFLPEAHPKQQRRNARPSLAREQLMLHISCVVAFVVCAPACLALFGAF